ncbi:MAG: hypothetical protein KKB31_01900 [Nanoarchaeota archaeon]|nr:hypothetical protein [Nanoarchaeota archaeon]
MKPRTSLLTCLTSAAIIYGAGAGCGSTTSKIPIVEPVMLESRQEIGKTTWENFSFEERVSRIESIDESG